MLFPKYFERCLKLRSHLPFRPPSQLEHSPSSIVSQIHLEAQSYGVAESIIWLGVIPPEKIAQVYSSIDVLVFPSLQESYGMPLAEAICSGVPVAASDLPFAREILGDAGVYFDPNCPQDMARLIVDLIRDSVKMDSSKVAAAERSNQFKPETASRLVCELFENIVSERNAT